MKIYLILLFSLIPTFVVASPECDYHFQIGNVTVEVLENSQVVDSNISLNRGQNSPNGRCRVYRVFFSKGVANNYQRKAYNIFGKSLNYNLHENINQSGILKEFGDALDSNEFLQGEAPEKFTNYTKAFFVSTPGSANNIIQSGIYFDLVQATIYGYNQNSGQYLFEETDTFTIVFNVPKKIHLSLLDEGAAFEPSSTSKVLDFGILSQHQERGADLRVMSNGSYQIKISSQNNGKLKLFGKNETVTYGLTVDGASVALGSSSSSPVNIGSGNTTSSAGDKYNLRVKIIENTSNKSAGMYQDVLTITAIAN